MEVSLYQTLSRSTLTWIKYWCLLLNYSNLKLEDHYLPSGWHHYLWLEGKIPHSFTIHFLTKMLIKTWLKLQQLLYLQIPTWVSPLEVVSNINEKPPNYSMLLEKERMLKMQLKPENINLDWWHYNHLK